MLPLTPLSDAQQRQSIDAEAAFTALEEARRDAAAVRGSMLWREQGGRRYLVRESPGGGQKSLGPDSTDNQAIYERFVARKAEAGARLTGLKAAVAEQVRLNRALRVGRVPAVVVDILAALADAGLAEDFLVVGTHALYAYEAAAGVRVQADATATRDIDLLFDTQRRIGFLSRLGRADRSLLAVLRRADKTFKVRRDQLQTAVNADGFEIDVIRRTARDGDAHPMRMSDDESDLWAVQVPSGERLLGAAGFSQVVTATNGRMARMHTIQPLQFARTKRLIAQRPDRDPRKRSKDALQADIVEAMLAEYLPQLPKP